jgi:PqqD family protein of HPr-rel-A system
MRFRAPASDALLIAELDAFTAMFHRPSGITHLLVSPAPEILAILAGEALSIEALLERLGGDYDLADADVASLAARVDELVEAGLLSAA